MNNTICYLNTDLELSSTEDLTDLAKALETGSVFPLHVTLGEDGLWHAWFETKTSHSEPESNIADILTTVERLSAPFRSVWDQCTRREFNVGYDCGEKPWAFNQSLSVVTLGRMAAVGASLRVTLYPDRE